MSEMPRVVVGALPVGDAYKGRSMKVNFSLDVDWKLLREQERRLVEVISAKPDNLLQGIVHLIDAVQDHAVDVCGVSKEEVFGAAVKDCYDGGCCPDCGELIPDTAEFGDSCSNCGHAFVLGKDDL